MCRARVGGVAVLPLVFQSLDEGSTLRLPSVFRRRQLLLLLGNVSMISGDSGQNSPDDSVTRWQVSDRVFIVISVPIV